MEKTLTEEQRQTITPLVYGEVPTQRDKAILPKLIQKEVLEQTELGDWRFQVPSVQRFIEGVLQQSSVE